MSAHYSKYGLNTYYATPYFQAHIPAHYPLQQVLQKCRAFRRLPPRLRELSGLAKRWAVRTYPPPNDFGGINDWYDADGYELNPGTGARLTDKEIDAEWERWGTDGEFEVEDIPLPAGGFADPDTWKEPPREEEIDLVDRSGMIEADIVGWIRSHGFKRVATDFGVPEDWLSDDTSNEELARMILDMHGKPWPARSSSDVTAG